MGFGKTQNILAGNRIRLIPGKRDSLQFEQGFRDFLACLSGIQEVVRSSGKYETTRRTFTSVSSMKANYKVT